MSELKVGTSAPGYFSGVPCDRTDCRFEENGPSHTTLLGWKKVYNHEGLRVDEGDPNTTSQEYYCLTCNKRWVRRSCRDGVSWCGALKS